MNADKFGLGFPVLLVAMSASRACAGRVARIDNRQRDPGHQGFVGKKGSELGERPRMVLSSLPFSDNHCVSNVCQVFDGNSFSLGNGFFDNAFGNGVVGNGCEPSFPPTQPFQEFSTPSCAFGLNGTSDSLIVLPNGIQRIGRVIRSVRERGNVVDPEVDPDKLFHIVDLRIGNLDCLKQVKLPLLRDKIRFPFDIGKVFGIVTDKGNRKAASGRPERCHRPFVGKDPAIVGNGSERLESMQGFLACLVGLADFSKTPDEHLGRKDAFRFEIMVKGLMQFEMIENLLCKGKFRDPIAGMVCLFHRFKKTLALFFRRKKFDLQGQFHKEIMFQIFEFVNPSLKGEAHSSPA